MQTERLVRRLLMIAGALCVEMLSIVRSNTNAAVIAITEKAANILLGNEPAKAL